MERNNSEVADHLINQLSGYGLTSAETKDRILNFLSLQLPVFTLTFDRLFQTKKVNFAARVVKEPESPGGYRVKDITATLNEQTTWPAKIIEGIDVESLDKLMGTLDWKAWYNNPDKSGIGSKAFSEVMEAIARLQQANTIEARQTLLLLITRNWPEPMLEIYGSMGEGYPAREDFLCARDKQQHHTFDLEEWPQFSAALAFLVVTGQDDLLARQIHNILFPSRSLAEIKKELYSLIRSYPQDFHYCGSESRPDQYLEYRIPVLCKQGQYEVQSYQVAAKYYPPVPEGECEGISFRELDKRMQAINWKDSVQVYSDPRDPLSDHTAKVAGVEADLHTLSKDLVACSVANLLRLKYHQDIAFFKTMIGQSAFDTLADIRPVTSSFPVHISLNKSAALLEGKAVSDFSTINNNPAEADWIQLAPDSINSGSEAQLLRFNGPSRWAIEHMFDMLLIQSSAPRGYQQRLMDGGEVVVANSMGLVLHIGVDIGNKSLKVSTSDGKPIPFNFHFDPEFTVALEEKQNIKKDRQRRLRP